MGSVPVHNRYWRAAKPTGPTLDGHTHREAHHDHFRRRTPAPTALAPHFSGELIDRDHPAYDAARQVWNGEIHRRPGLIARARGAADVAAAIRFAREHDLPASVRGGGHAVAGHAVLDDGVVIDLSGDDRHPRRPGGAHDPASRVAPAVGRRP